MHRYLIDSFTKVTAFGIIGSWAALRGLGVENIIISSEDEIQIWFSRN